MAAAPSSAPRSSRILAIDAGRLVATFGIVWVHTTETQGLSPRVAALGRFGTSFYIASAMFMTALPFFRNPETRRGALLESRARRLLVPYLTWSLIYAAFYLATMLPQGHSLAAITSLWGPLGGTAPHLWFLPFAFLSSAVLVLVLPRLLHASTRRLWALSGLAVPLAYVGSFHVLLSLDHGALAKMGLVRLGRYVEEAPFALACILGVSLYGAHRRALGRLGRYRRRLVARLFLAMFLATQTAYFFCLEPLRHLLWTEIRPFANLAGALWLSLCLAVHSGRWTLRISRYGRATYFAFLVHQLVLDMIKGPLASWPGHGTFGFALATALLVFGASLALGIAVPRVRALRWLVP